MLEMPRYHGLVHGTLAVCGTAITSPASARRISHCPPAQASPSRDCSTWAAVFAASRVASSCWKARRSSFAARAIAIHAPSAESGDLREQFLSLHRFHNVVARTLPESPDLVGLLALGGAQNDRDRAGGRVPADCARGLEAVQARHDDIHQDQVRLDRLRLENGVFA